MQETKRIILAIVLLISLGATLAACGSGAASPEPTSTRETIEPTLTLEGPPTIEVIPPTEVESTPTWTVEAPILPAVEMQPLEPLSSGDLIIQWISMTDENVGWGLAGTASQAQHVLYTQNGGKTWEDRSPEAETGIYEYEPPPVLIARVDAMTLWASYPPYNEVWKTSDAGMSWTVEETPSQFSVRGWLYANDASQAWLLKSIEAGMGNEYVELYRTRDGGASWKKIVDPYTDESTHGCMKTGLAFSPEGEGWITLDCQGFYLMPFIYRSPDSGESWESVSLPVPETLRQVPDEGYCLARSPMFDDQRLFLLVDCMTVGADEVELQTFLYWSDDSGTSWAINTYPGGELNEMGTARIGALGEDLYVSDDLGQSWTRLKTVAWAGQFSFVDRDVGWAIARAGEEVALVQTRDGGQTWQEIEPVLTD